MQREKYITHLLARLSVARGRTGASCSTDGEWQYARAQMRARREARLETIVKEEIAEGISGEVFCQ